MSKLAIYQKALSLIGDSQNIEALSDSDTIPARDECDRWYDTALESGFKAANWFFCRAFEQFVEADTTSWVTNPNPGKYPYVYVWKDPTQYVLQFVEYPNRGIVLENELNYVLGYQSGSPPANNTNWYALSRRELHGDRTYAAWTDMQFSEANFPTYFDDVVAAELSVLIAAPLLKNNPNKVQIAYMRAETLRGRAIAFNDNADYASKPNHEALDRYTAASKYGYGA